MVPRNLIGISLSLALALAGATSAEARSHRAHAVAHSSHHAVTHTSHHHKGHAAAATHSSAHHSGHHKASAATKTKHVAHKDKHAYALDFFMMRAPDFDRTPFPEELASKLHDDFNRGIADDANAEKLVRAGIFKFYPLSGGIFNRREVVKYIVLHSTETGVPVPGKNVINGWNSMGRRHPGAQFVVDRDGTILLAVDPDLGTVHVNIFKTLPGINNDNSIGIEMNHNGRQDYPAPQRAATMKLLSYLQNRFKVTNENVITHRYAQQGDHTDPVNFDLEGFLATKEDFRTRAIALKRSMSPAPVDEETEDDAPLASVYVQIHGPLPELTVSSKSKNRPANLSSINQNVEELPMQMPKGTFVAGGGQLQPGSSPATEEKSSR